MMTSAQLESLYEQHIRQLPEEDQLSFLILVAQNLAARVPKPSRRQHSVLEFAGAGRHNPVGMDAQEYVRELRKEWEHRP